MSKGNRLRKLKKESGRGTKKQVLLTLDTEVLRQGQMIDGDGVATGENHVTASEGIDELSEDGDYASEKCTAAGEECTVTHNLHGLTNPGDEDATSDMLAKFEKAYFKKFHETIMLNPALLTEKGFAERFHFDNCLYLYEEAH
ncbi:hypothetical protein MKW98_022817 [Papaver atlanticum]|uniref:Uncharacterized protein n=1 Tax=Papaver atlanticum TaxID=357466 RepID=A0AAD4TNK8_9MAGN|nr:hypothetical protein MKW98_022817 [Papaver atlanticum]